MSGVLPAAHPRHGALMRVAVQRSVRALGRTRPNPCVGAVVARDGVILAVGHHQQAGQPHAEIHALRDAGEAARGADLYVTLEPCSHHGRTPPCVDAIVRSGVARVFVATQDVNPKVNGQGVAHLRAAGVEVHVGLCQEQAREVLAPFFHWVQQGHPLTWLKAAVSLDGRLATAAGDSAGMSSPRAHAWLHRVRDRVDAILVGVGTIRADNPRLTARRPVLGGRGPSPLVRVVLDTHARTPPNAQILAPDPHSRVWVCVGSAAPPDAVEALEARGAQVFRFDVAPNGHLPLEPVWQTLGAQGITSVLVEGGARIHGALLHASLAHRAAVVVTPRILGSAAIPLAFWPGPPALAQAVEVASPRWRPLGRDTLLEGTVRYGF